MKIRINVCCAVAVVLLLALRLVPAAADPRVGAIAPNFKFTRADGNAARLSDYAGKVVVVDFWATWCPPCRQSLPQTDSIARRFQPRGVVFLPVCTADTEANFGNWIAHHTGTAMTWCFDPAGEDKTSAIAGQYDVKAIPTQIVIDKQGKIASVFVGYEAESDPQEKALQKVLNTLADPPPAEPASIAVPNLQSQAKLDTQVLYTLQAAAFARKDPAGAMAFTADPLTIVDMNGRSKDVTKSTLMAALKVVFALQVSANIQPTVLDVQIVDGGAAVTVRQEMLVVLRNPNTGGTVKQVTHRTSRDFWVKQNGTWALKRSRILEQQIQTQ